MNGRPFGFACALVVIGVLAHPPAVAAILSNGDAVGSDYTIENIDSGLTIDFTTHTPADANSKTIGELTMFLSHSSLVWLGFDLVQNAAATADSNEKDGLRVLLDVRDTNGMTVPWVDYHIRAKEYSEIDFSGLPPEERPDERAHKSVAHFHNTPAGYGSSPLSPQGSQNNVVQLDFGLPSPVLVGDELTVNDILVHERDFEGYKRSFRVETLPSISEPTSLVLAALGLLGMLGVSSGGRRSMR